MHMLTAAMTCIVLIVAGLMGCAKTSNAADAMDVLPPTTLISVLDADKKHSDKQVVFLDVREKTEWNEAHISAAAHIPLGDLPNRMTELSAYKDRPIVVYCRSGKRSAKAAVMLQKAGFKQVSNLNGGINAWQTAGLDVAK